MSAPLHRPGSVRIAARDLEAFVEPTLAGRVLSLVHRGRELFTGPEANAANFGSTYWTSPQTAWGWPPVAAIDSEPFEIVGTEPLTLRGPVANLGGQAVRSTKIFRADPARGVIEIEYRLDNESDRELRVAGWEISRVEPGGLTLFPTGRAALTPVPPHGELVVERAHGYSFYDHASFRLGQSIKLHADGERGLLAHVTPADEKGERLLFSKAFEDSTPHEQAPGEGEIEIFANEDGRYVEIEVQSRIDPVPPGGSQVFRVSWHVEPVPSDVDVRSGSESLVEFVEATARRLFAREPAVRS